MKKVISFELLDWEMTSFLSGIGPIRMLLEDDSEVVIKPGLGPGYWQRASELAEEQGIFFHENAEKY